MVSGTRALLKYVVVKGSRAAAPKRSMTYAFTHMGNLLFLAIGDWAFWLGFGLEGWDFGL